MAENELQRAAARATFGDELRKEREIRGVSLKEIAEATKVSRRFLAAIEKDDYKKLPAPVFARGFVREYARYLGLDAEEMVTRYIHYTHSLEDPELEEQPEPLHSDRVTGEIPRPYARVDRNIWIFLVLLAIFIGAIFGVRAWMASRSESSAAPPAEDAAPSPSALPANEERPSDPEIGPADTTALPASLIAASGGGRGGRDARTTRGGLEAGTRGRPIASTRFARTRYHLQPAGPAELRARRT
ncbi:MAG TPA: helix-turn-helix domain-containing protein [Thermoanaerobaculia bacterium]|nr:helix-turn-helix domain-containing protein [Thermoanaerobaculia bacterium]